MMNIFSIPPLIISLLSITLGTIVYFKNRKPFINKIFLYLCFVSSIWLLFYALAYNSLDKETALRYLRIGYCGVIFIAISTFHFVVEFLKIKKLEKVIYFIYLIGFGFLISIWSSTFFIKDVYKFYWGFYPIAGFLHPVFLIFFIGLAVISETILLYFLLFRKELSSRQRNQIKYLFSAFIVYNFAGVDFLANYKIKIYPFGYLPSLLFIGIIGYSIFRYRLMDIYLVIKRTAAYSLSVGLLTAVFAILVITGTNLFSSFAKVSSLKINIIAALIIAISFNPLRYKIQILIDKVFYKKTYDYYHTIQEVSSTLASMFDREKIFQFVTNVIIESMGLKNVYLLAGSPGSTFNVVSQTTSQKDKNIKKKEEPEKKKEEPEKKKEIKTINFTEVPKYFKQNSEILIKDELSRIEEVHGEDFAGRIKKEFEVFYGEVIVPVYLDKKLSYLIILGEKLSGDIFTNEDINLLNTISVQTAIAIKNAGLYQEKVNAEKLVSLGMMSGTFAHEIRNPLTSLKTFAQLMPEKYDDPEFRNTFSRIVIGDIQKIDGLISDLLDFSTEKRSTRMNKFNLVELVDGVVDYIENKLDFERSKITIEKNYHAQNIDMIGDTEKLGQALGNIVLNGCQAMHGEGVLQIEIKPNGRNVDITVEDTGEGINPEDLPKIFDPFVTTKKMGIGLGLAISKKIIENFNGKIYVNSQPAQGTTFTISLPVQNQ